MFHLGIDVSKVKSDYCFIDDNQKIIKSFSNFNSLQGLEKTLKEIYSVSTDPTKISMALEATGIFWQPVYYFFKDHSFNITLLNPYSVKHFTKMRLSKTKTDKMDSYQIACCIESGYAKKSIVPDDTICSLRDLVRTKNYITSEIYNIKRKISTTLFSVFTEYETVFKHPFSITSLTIFKKYPSAYALQKANKDELVKIFRSIKGNNNSITKAESILSTAKLSITPKDGIKGKEISLKNMIAIFETLDKHKTQLDFEIESILNSIETTLEDKCSNFLNPIQAVLSIPGVGKKTIAVIIGSCGDLSSFNSSISFIGYIGLYPQIIQSGKKNKSEEHKKSIPLVKKQLYCASVACLKHNPELKQIYLNALSKGFTKKSAICKVMYKLAKIIWHLYNHKCKYDAKFVFRNKLIA